MEQENRLQKQLNFIMEIDKLKAVLRRSLLADGSRRENSAEHSWHFALMVVILQEYAPNGSIDLLKTVKMALVHDIVEIDAGDTYIYDKTAMQDKKQREQEAAKRIFSLLPEDQTSEIMALWQEFEDGQSEEAKLAQAIDRLNPFMQNFAAQGKTWKENKISQQQVVKVMEIVKINAPALWPHVEDLIKKGVKNGWLMEN